MWLLIGLSYPVAPVATVLVFSRYASRSYLDRVSVVPWTAIAAQLVGLFVCGAMHLALLGTAASAMAGNMPSEAARDWSAWVATIGSAIFVILFLLSSGTGNSAKTTEQLGETVRKRISNLWPAMLSVQCAYTTGASVVLGHNQGQGWAEAPVYSTLILIALALAYTAFFHYLQLKVLVLADYVDLQMKGTYTQIGCSLAQPYFTMRNWVNDFFAAWPIFASGYLALAILFFADTDNMRDPTEWRRMVPYVPLSAVGAVLTASVWQYTQPLVWT